MEIAHGIPDGVDPAEWYDHALASHLADPFQDARTMADLYDGLARAKHGAWPLMDLRGAPATAEATLAQLHALTADLTRRVAGAAAADVAVLTKKLQAAKGAFVALTNGRKRLWRARASFAASSGDSVDAQVRALEELHQAEADVRLMCATDAELIASARRARTAMRHLSRAESLARAAAEEASARIDAGHVFDATLPTQRALSQAMQRRREMAEHAQDAAAYADGVTRELASRRSMRPGGARARHRRASNASRRVAGRFRAK
jgi:hypothetical protein